MDETQTGNVVAEAEIGSIDPPTFAFDGTYTSYYAFRLSNGRRIEVRGDGIYDQADLERASPYDADAFVSWAELLELLDTFRRQYNKNLS